MYVITYAIFKNTEYINSIRDDLKLIIVFFLIVFSSELYISDLVIHTNLHIVCFLQRFHEYMDE